MKIIKDAELLKITDSELIEKLIKWGEQVSIKIDNDEIVAQNISEYVNSLENDFQKWANNEKSKDGKK
jgi:hypothetical protein